MIYDQSGNKVKTYWQFPDSDGDKLDDNEEVDVELTTISIPGKCGNPDTIKFFHKMHSRPDLADSDGDNIGDAIDYEPNTPNAFNPFSSSCFNFVEYYYSKYYTDDDEQAIRDCYRLILTRLMVCVHRCRRPDLISDEDWLEFCKQFNRCVREVGEVDETLHYFRNKINRIPSSFQELIDNKQNWVLYSKGKTKYHMNDGDFISTNPEYPSYSSYNNLYNLKFVDKNGIYEVIVTPKGDISDMSDAELEEYLKNPSNWQIITDDPYNENPNFKYDPVNMGTYNYCAYEKMIPGHDTQEDNDYHHLLDIYPYNQYANVLGLFYGNDKDTADNNFTYYDSNADDKVYQYWRGVFYEQ